MSFTRAGLVFLMSMSFGQWCDLLSPAFTVTQPNSRRDTFRGAK
jgi:hypothetical protein